MTPRSCPDLLEAPDGDPRSVGSIDKRVMPANDLRNWHREPECVVDHLASRVITPALQDVVHGRDGNAALALLHEIDGELAAATEVADGRRCNACVHHGGTCQSEEPVSGMHAQHEGQ